MSLLYGGVMMELVVGDLVKSFYWDGVNVYYGASLLEDYFSIVM